jgi:hypothetical protein
MFYKNKKYTAVLVAAMASLTMSTASNAIVTLELNSGSTSSAVTALVSDADVAPIGSAAVNTSSTSTHASLLSVGTTDTATATGTTGGPGVNTTSVSNIGNGYAYSDSIVTKTVRFQADTAGLYTVNSFLDAGSTGTTAGPNGYGLSSSFAYWTVHLGGVLLHGLNVTETANQLAFGLTGIASSANLNVDVVGTSSLVQAAHGTSATYNWDAQSFSDSVRLAAGQSIDVLYYMASNVRSNYFDDLTTLATCGANCGTSWTNLSGNFTTEFLADSVTAVPEPGEWALMIAGLGSVGAMSKRKNRKQAA